MAIETYADLARVVGDCVLCNRIAERELEHVSGELFDEDGEAVDVFQWYIVADASFLIECTDEIVFYDPDLDVHVWAITHFGTAWDCVPCHVNI